MAQEGLAAVGVQFREHVVQHQERGLPHVLGDQTVHAEPQCQGERAALPLRGGQAGGHPLQPDLEVVAVRTHGGHPAPHVIGP